MIGIGLIGYGHWGPNHARTFNGQADSHVVAIADASEKRLEAAQKQVPYVTASSDHRAVIDHPEVDAVVIATPLTTHYGLVKEALLAGKDVLVEKPLCYTSQEAQELCDLAEERGRILMCGHIFLFNAGINRLREYILDGTLGRVYYMAATRTNLGPVRGDANALYDLGSHDVSIFHHLLGTRPLEAAAWGESFLQHRGRGRRLRQPRISRPDHLPHARELAQPAQGADAGRRRRQEDGRVGRHAAAGVDPALRQGPGQQPHYDSFGQFQLMLRDADILIPKLKAVEPLVAQDMHFLECVRERKTPLSDGAVRPRRGGVAGGDAALAPSRRVAAAGHDAAPAGVRGVTA